MSNKLFATGKYILFEKAEQKMDALKSSLVMNSDALNPHLLYGKVIDSGEDCSTSYTGKFIYVNRMNAIKLNHDNNEYYIVSEPDVYVMIEGE